MHFTCKLHYTYLVWNVDEILHCKRICTCLASKRRSIDVSKDIFSWKQANQQPAETPQFSSPEIASIMSEHKKEQLLLAWKP